MSASGRAYIQSTFNNTIITVTDSEGGVLSWASSGSVGFKGSRKSTPFAARLGGRDGGHGRAIEYGMRRVDVYVKGPGQRSGDGNPLAPDGGARDQQHSGRHAHSA